MSNIPLQSGPETSHDLHDKISQVELKSAKRFDVAKENDHQAERPSGIDRVFGKSGKIHRVLSPKHLLHTLPPDYPLSMAIDFLLKFLESLEDCLQSEKAKAEQLEIEMVEIFPGLSRMEKQLKQLKSEQIKAFLKFRYDKAINELAEKISASNRQLENLIRAKRGATEQIETIEHDIQLFNLRTAELIRQYLIELEVIPSDQLAQYLANPVINELHQRILNAELILS